MSRVFASLDELVQSETAESLHKIVFLRGISALLDDGDEYSLAVIREVGARGVMCPGTG